MLERMEISESIYKGVVEPPYKNPTRADSNRSGHVRNKRGEAASSNTRPATGESDVKHQKLYVFLSKSEYKNLSCSHPRTFF